MAIQDYDLIGWVNDSAPAINATNLNKMDRQLQTTTSAIKSLEENPYSLPPANEATLGGVKVKVIDNGDGTFDGEIWVS